MNTASNPTAELTTADSSFCPGTGSVTVTATGGATYVWYFNGNTTSGATNTLTVTQSGNYYVVVTNSSQCAATSNSIGMSLQSAPLASISTSNTNICSGNAVTLTADMVSGVTYEWKLNGNSLGAASSVNTYSATQAGSYTCVVSNGCESTSNAIVLGVSSAPASPTTLLLGGDHPCIGGFDEYKVSPVNGATGYTWTIVPAGAAFVQQGQGTDDVVITFLNQNCSIQVSAFNGCGASAPTALAVTMDNSFMCNGTSVAFGASPSNTCQGSTVTYYNYSDQSAVAGLNPVWDFGAGANPATSTSSGPVTVTYSTPGFKDVLLTYNDGFGNYVTSYGINSYINVSGAISTSAITGNTQLPDCNGNVETYSVTNTAGSAYNWTVSGGSIVSGQGTSSISVNFPSTGGTVSVTETNAAGCVGSPQSVTANCTPVGVENVAAEISSLSVYPNPTSGLVTIDAYLSKTADYQLQLMNLEGKEIISQNGAAVAGEFKHNLNLSNMPAGIYFIRIKMAGEVVSKKVVLQ